VEVVAAEPIPVVADREVLVEVATEAIRPLLLRKRVQLTLVVEVVAEALREVTMVVMVAVV
jgi:hypothetical protein